MTVPRISAIVLAGGRSSRFGRDKLAEPIEGRPLLEHAVAAVRGLAAEVLVVVAPGADLALPEGAIQVNDPAAFEGPLAGVLAGLRAATNPVVLVVGGDMPSLVGSVLESMLTVLDVSGGEAVALDHDGRTRPIPLVLRRDPALAATERMFAGGERRLRALPETLATHVVAESTWRTLDPGADTVRDIDTPADLIDR